MFKYISNIQIKLIFVNMEETDIFVMCTLWTFYHLPKNCIECRTNHININDSL